MVVDFSFITGMMLGIELLEDIEDEFNYLVIDLLILRIMFIKDMRET